MASVKMLRSDWPQQELLKTQGVPGKQLISSVKVVTLPKNKEQNQSQTLTSRLLQREFNEVASKTSFVIKQCTAS